MDQLSHISDKQNQKSKNEVGGSCPKRFAGQPNDKPKKYRREMVVGMKGFLCSCNWREKDSVKEAYNLLNEYEESEEVRAEPQYVPASDEQDVDCALKEEINALKFKKSKFKSVDTRVKNLVFISTTVDSPSKLCDRIFADIYQTGNCKSMFLLRMVPIDLICYFDKNTLKQDLTPFLEKYFKTGYNSYKVICNIRNNSSAHTIEAIHLVAALIHEINQLNVVSLTEPKLVVVVEIIRKLFCISVVENYFKYKKYNLAETAKKIADE